MDIDSKRIDSLAKYRLGWKVTDICRSEGICRKTFYNWLNVYKKQGQRGLVKKSTRPKTIRYAIPDDVIGKIERFFGTFKTQVESFKSVKDYVKYYNYEKPHKSLGYQTPSERYFEKSV